jgi:hypothetical protein
MRTIYGVQFDAVAPLPFTPALQALYINGRFATPPQYGRGRVYIDVLGTAPRGAFWRDIERGDGTPADFPGWLDQRHAAGMGWGGGYCSRNLLPEMISRAGARPWSLWLATLDGTTDPVITLPPTVTLVAVQAIPAAMLGFAADLSVVTDPGYWERAL